MNRLKLLRKEQNKSQEEIAELLNVSAMTISRWENAEKLRLKTDSAQILADFFGVSVGYLLGYSSNPNINFSPANELKDDDQRVKKGKKIFLDYKGSNAVDSFEKDVLLWYTEKYSDIRDDSPTPSFFADNFKNQVYLTLAASQNFNNYISLLLTDFFSLPSSEWDRIALLISSYSDKLKQFDND